MQQDLEEKDDLMNEWIIQLMTRLFVEQPRLHQVWLLYIVVNQIQVAIVTSISNDYEVKFCDYVLIVFLL